MAFNPQRIKQEMKQNGVTVVLLTIQVTFFILMTLYGLANGYGLDGTTQTQILVKFGAMYAPLVAMGEYWRLITPIFLHIGLVHLILNSFFLYFAGKELEAMMGRIPFLIFYILSGLSGNLLSFAFGPMQTVSAGASTALFGLFGGFIALGRIFPYHPRVQYMARNMLALVVVNLVFNLFSQGIDMFGHIGGLIGGLLLGFAISGPQVKKSRYNVTEDNKHRRIASGIGFLFFVVFCIVYGIQRYGAFF